ncbi:MAG: hypothetical protein JSV91_07810 [Phycisphaerales bacterium]|nr:MAG: hypothetical protein JSV91_07810 [Phycisphaerales bacterium]
MKRETRFILLALVIGAVFTIASAWLASWIGASRLTPRPALPQVPRARRLFSDTPALQARGFIPVSIGVIDGWHIDIAVMWVLDRHREGVKTGDYTEMQTVWAGWPARSLTGDRINAMTTASGGDPTVAGIRYEWAWGPDSSGGSFVRWKPRLVPLRPMWPGFAINTLLHALIAWLLIRGPFIARHYSRREIRRRRGRCLKCGYELRGDYGAGCPECGWNREKVVV